MAEILAVVAVLERMRRLDAGVRGAAPDGGNEILHVRHAGFDGADRLHLLDEARQPMAERRRDREALVVQPLHRARDARRHALHVEREVAARRLDPSRAEDRTRRMQHEVRVREVGSFQPRLYKPGTPVCDETHAS